MNIYSVYTDSDKKETPPMLIKQEFSVVAGLFAPLWALYYRMWFVAFLIFFVAFILNFLNISSISYSIVAFLFFGCFASQIREYYAQKKYALAFSDVILANDLEEAELKYYIRTSNN
jgi:hypothetical protein